MKRGFSCYMRAYTLKNFAGLVPNARGRVLSSMEQGADRTEEGLFVVGWLKRGPTGIIGTNLIDAEETVCFAWKT